MRTYKRIRIQGGTYFFTLTLAERRGNDLLVRHISALRAAFRQTLADHPVTIEAIVVLPDHLHCLWRLPAGDDDFPTRWRLIKSRFSRQIPAGERISNSRAGGVTAHARVREGSFRVLGEADAQDWIGRPLKPDDGNSGHH